MSRCLLFMLLTGVRLLAQPSVTGVVVDAETRQPVPFAHVFVSNTTYGAVTDVDGSFGIEAMQPGDYQLAVSFVGYKTLTRALKIGPYAQKITLLLEPDLQALENVTVQGTKDKEWTKNLRTFKRQFLGETDNARACEIVNPWVLEFEKRGSAMRAIASEPLEIINQRLGYRLFVYLSYFQSSNSEYSIVGPVRFQELEPSEPSRAQYRQQVFFGSTKHFLHSLAKGQTRNVGYKIFQAVNALQEQARSPYFERDLNVVVKEAKPESLLRVVPGGFVLAALKPVEVHYEKAADFEPVYKDVLHQVSWIQSSTGWVKFDTLGNILNPREVVVSGYWNRLRIADLLPLDYDATGTQAPAVQVKPDIRLISDKDVYEQGDKIWYAALVRGLGEGSSTVQVDLIDSAENVVARRLDPVEVRKAAGYFELPRRGGRFFLRAATPDTYRAGKVFMKPIAVVAPGYRWEASDTMSMKPAQFHRLHVSWRADSLHSSRVVQMVLTDKDLDTLFGNYLVSVRAHAGREKGFEGRLVEFSPPTTTEQGEVAPTGVVRNARGKALQGRVTLLTSDLAFSFDRKLDNNGRFKLDEVVVYDSVTWLVQYFDEKERPQTDFVVTWEQPFEMKFPKLTWQTPWRIKQVVETVSTTSEPDFKLADGTLLLKEITVKAKKETNSSSTFRTYGSAQFVIKGEDLQGNPAGTNVLSALIGRVPGLVGQEAGNSWSGFSVKFNVRGNSSLMGASDETPLILIDGMPYENSQMAYEILQTIPLTDIDRVEVRKGLSPLQTFKKGSGTIAVYTKRSGVSVEPSHNPNPYLRKVSQIGYSRPAAFAATGFSPYDTWYWDPFATFNAFEPYTLTLPLWLNRISVRVVGFDAAGEMVDAQHEVSLEN